jgi:F0F1-type ATP synthase membrane subunit c/vacuolar-type H+-ATPase subunit K
MLLFTKFPLHILSVPVLLGAGLCMGLGAIGSGVGSGFPAGAACIGMSRQPAMSGRLTTNMLIGSAVCQTPAIFSLVVAFILLFTDFSANPVSPTWAAILGAGISSGFGSIGSGLGGGLVAQASCEGISRQPLTVTPVTNVMLLGQAVTQTTAIYALLVSFILMFKSFPATDALAPPMALLAAGICMGIGAIGPAVGEGFAGQGAVAWIARNQKSIADLTRSMLVGQAVAESTGIYSLVIALVLIFVV